MLDKFRETAITWDKASRKVYEPLRASAGDNKGRKLSVQIVNDGVIEDLSGASLSLFWETKDKAHKGLDAFTAVNPVRGEFEIYYTTGMLSNEGTLNANLVLVDASGRIVSEPFTITVFKGIDDDAIQSSDSFTALAEALITVNQYNSRITNVENSKVDKSTFEQSTNDLTAQLQQTEQDLNAQLAQISHIVPRPDGVNDRRIISEAIDYAKNNNLHILFSPNETYTLIAEKEGESFVVPGDNMVIDLNGSRIQLAPNGFKRYQIFYINGVSGVTIRNGIIQGDRENHDYSEPGTHEFGYGLNVRQSSAVLEFLEVYDMTGDSVIISDFTDNGDGTFSDGTGIVRIRNCEFHHNDRQGITVLESNEVYIDRVHIHDIYGVAPQACIDIEPATRTKHVNKFELNNSVLEKTGSVSIVASGTCSSFKVSDCTLREKIMIGEGIQNPLFVDTSIYMHKTDTNFATPYANKNAKFINCEITANRYNMFGSYENCTFRGIDNPVLETVISLYRNGETKLKNCEFHNIRATNKRALKFTMINNEPELNIFDFDDVKVFQCDVDLQNADLGANTNNYQPKISGVDFINSYLHLQRGVQVFRKCSFVNNEYRETPTSYTTSLIRLIECYYKGNNHLFNLIRKDLFNTMIELNSVGEGSFGMSGQPSYVSGSYLQVKETPLNADLTNAKIINSFIRVHKATETIDFQSKLFNSFVEFNV